MKERKRRITRFLLSAIVTVGVVLWIGNTSRFAKPSGDGPTLLAHRALGQGFETEGLTGKTCTAARMLPPEHAYLENTIPSISAAFEFGADVVELDVHPTADGHFAVFHDWTLECRTEGRGVTREHTLTELRKLDVGYGYTADGGKTWPFRGKGVGMMPSLDEVLDAFPDKTLLIDVKGNDPEEGDRLADRIATAMGSRTGEIWVTGGATPVAIVRSRLPEVRTISRRRLKKCLTRYLALGWTGHVPDDCTRSVILVPANVAPLLWGWPNRFLQRMERGESRVFLLGDWRGEGFSTGFDDPARLDELPTGYSGGIFTGRIDLMGPATRSRD